MKEMVLTFIGCLLFFNILLFYKEEGFESTLGTRLLKIIFIIFLLLLTLIFLLWDTMTKAFIYFGWRQTKIVDYFAFKNK